MARLLKTVLIIIVIAGLLAGAWLFFSDDKTSEPDPQTSNTNTTNSEFNFDNPKKSAHYESNTPAHGSILAGVPVNVVIDFNFDLATPSEINITSNGSDYGTGATIIDQNKLSMRRSLNKDAPNGLYTVEYNACWPDGSCHDGSFQFAIDRTKAEDFSDLRGQSEVTIRMADLNFQPESFRISTGTKVNWINDDTVDHYVNTDSHPAHTHQLDFNSRAIKAGETYSYTFASAGLYPYHCSAHPEDMKGNILVE